MAARAGPSAAPLALEYTAHGQAAGWRRGEDLIDALPYVDAMPADVKRQVEAMVEEEAKRSLKRPSDYLKELSAPPPTLLDKHPLLLTELDRVKAQQPMAALDVSRYRLDAPQGAKRHDLGAWKAAVDNAHSQLEHQYLRIVNLELMLKYGDKNWRAQGQLADSLVKQYEAELAETKSQITAINQERKLSQTAAGSELRRAEGEYFELLAKNAEIDAACDKVEREVFRLKQAAEAEAAKEAGAGAGAAEGPAGAAEAAGGVTETGPAEAAASGQGDQPMADGAAS